MEDKNTDQYQVLISKFLGRNISVEEFEREYLKLFKNETNHFPSEIFEVLDILFSDIDVYCGDDILRGDNELDEAQLRLSCKKALLDLNIMTSQTR